jgi:hypothetical protein
LVIDVGWLTTTMPTTTTTKNNMSDDDDDEPNVFYRDARDGLLTSAADKKRKALNHFTYFLKGYCVQIGVKAVKADGVPYHGLLLHETHLSQAALKSIFAFWDDCIGAFMTYMGSHARAGCNPKGQRISQSTAEGYSSSVKVYLTNKFRTETAIPVFQKLQWNKLREKLKGL